MPSPARKSDPAIWDLEGALDRTAGDELLLMEIAVFVLNDGPPLMRQLQSALDSNSRHDIERSAHAIKGIAANVGGLRVERAALAVEDAARCGQLELARIAADALEQEFDSLVEVLQDRIHGAMHE